MALETLSKAIGNTIDLSVGDIVAKYGGNKKAIALAAQKGEIDPTRAVMAGMAVDRVVASAAQPQNTTVAEDVLAQQQPAGLGAMAPQGAAPQMGRPQAPQRPGQGLNQVPVPQRGFAQGGIIGFQRGGTSASLVAALDRVLSQMKASDPSLNVDYVKQSVLSAPPEQQQQLMQSLIQRVALDQTPTAAPPSFTQALSQREVDPRVMGAMQSASRGLTADEMAVPSPLSQTDTGAQAGAKPGVRDFTGSQVYAGLARGNMYGDGVNPLTGAMDIARSGIQGIKDTGRGIASLIRGQSPEQRLRAELEGANQPMMPPAQQIDQFSPTQTSEGYSAPVIADATQTDTGAADYTQQMNKDAVAAAQETAKPPEEEKKGFGGYDMVGMTKEAGKMAQEIMGKNAIKVPSVAEANEETKELLKASGFDENLFKSMREDLAKEREGLQQDKKEAMNMRLIEAGLGILGGESPYAFVNIGKGATPAIQGLAKDIKEIKKAGRDLKQAERNLQLKENDFALGKANITRSTIEKAQARFDDAENKFKSLQGDLTKTMLSGKIQEQITKSTYGSRMTDFDKKWKLTEEEAKRRGVVATPQLFSTMWSVRGGGMSKKDAITKALADATIDLSTEAGKKELEERVNYLMNFGSNEQAVTPKPYSDQDALAWANANPNDPRAKQIKAHLGVK